MRPASIIFRKIAPGPTKCFPTRDGKFTSFVMDPKVPYVEASVGIYNIFKLLQVEYVHRFTYRDNPGINKNGIRFMVLMVF